MNLPGEANKLFFQKELLGELESFISFSLSKSGMIFTNF